MNERIKELAEQALKHPDTDNDGLTVFDNDELEKFAELLIVKCANIVWDEAEKIDSHEVNSAGYKILEVFGIDWTVK